MSRFSRALTTRQLVLVGSEIETREEIDLVFRHEAARPKHFVCRASRPALRLVIVNSVVDDIRETPQQGCPHVPPDGAVHFRHSTDSRQYLVHSFQELLAGARLPSF